MSTIPSLSSVTDILDTDQVMITHSDGQSYKIAGSELNKRNQIIIASSTTITGTPLKTGNVVRVYFTADITGANTTSALVINYNGTNYNVKAPKNGALVNFVASNLGGSPVVYKYLQAYTTLELLFDGTQFVIVGNPVVISTADYTIYTDGKALYKPCYIKLRNKPLVAKSSSGGWDARDLGLDNSYIYVNGAGSLKDNPSAASIRSGLTISYSITAGVDGVNSHLFYITATLNNLTVGNTYYLNADIFTLKLQEFNTKSFTE